MAPLVFTLLAAVAGEPAEPATLEAGGGKLEVTFGGTEPSLPRAALLAWIDTSARVVSGYFGRFPVPRARLRVVTGTRGGIGMGTTWGGDVPAIRIAVGRRASQQALDDDWVLTHEMVHLAFPDLPPEHAWAEEGLATYVEPVARARAGRVSERQVASEWAEGMPRGMPEAGAGGLDGTREWARTYWGGALFWLMADVQIRERTGGRKGLEDALRGVLDAGGSIRVAWPLARALDAGDRACGVRVLGTLHDRMGRRRLEMDLGALLAKLGIVPRDGTAVLDDAAPLAWVRRAILRAQTRIGSAGGWSTERSLAATADRR
jgi:hypothetical protein